MGEIQIYEGKILIVDGKIAVHEDCCCNIECEEGTNTCNDCDPALQDYFYVTLPDDLDGDAAQFAGTTHKVPHSSGCNWINSSLEEDPHYQLAIRWQLSCFESWDVLLLNDFDITQFANTWCKNKNEPCDPEGSYSSNEGDYKDATVSCI